MTPDALLLSVKSEYATKIFDGTKTVELRRTRPRIVKGDLVLIYVPSPVKAVIGTFEVEGVTTTSPELLWQEIGPQTGITYEEFVAYYDGAMLATGILLNRTRRLYEPIQLDTLKAIWPNFHPPRSYCYLTPEQVNLTGIRHFFQETENSDRQKI